MPQPLTGSPSPPKRGTRVAAFCMAVGLFLLTASAQANEPPVPPGSDPGGPAIAVIGEGIDYTVPEVAAKLARDGEGDPIAWDFVDNDIRPYIAGGLTSDVRALTQLTPSFRLVIVREAAGDKVAVGRMIAFTVQTPARVVVWPSANPKRPDWPILLEALKRFPALIFVIPAIAGVKPAPNLFMPEAIASEASAARTDLWNLTARIATVVAAEPQIDPKALAGRLRPR